MVDIIRQTNLRTQDGCFGYAKEEQAVSDGGLSTFPSPDIFIPIWFLISEILHPSEEVCAINFQTQISEIEVISIWFLFVSSHWKFYENINQFLFTPWHDAAKQIWFPLNVMAKMFLRVLNETEENVGTSWGHLCGRQNGLFSSVFLSLLHFHKALLMQLLAGLTAEAYGSV